MDANVTKTKWNAKLIALVGMMAAVTCVLGPLSIPLLRVGNKEGNLKLCDLFTDWVSGASGIFCVYRRTGKIIGAHRRIPHWLSSYGADLRYFY